LRGDDLLPSTPRQILLYVALGLEIPSFSHVPLVLGPDGGRLAKRSGALSLPQLREKGEDPQAICGLLASLSGLATPDERLSPRDLVPRWDPEKLPTDPVYLPA
ncbi:MAG TPA: glutamate--tRNA ligase family protein, partial [Vulgatibacter sp.]